MADGLEVIPAALLVSEMREDGGIPGGAGKILALTERDVLSFGVLVALGEAEINDVNVVSGRIGAANQEVIGLDIAVNDALLVHLLNTANQLNGDHQDRLEVKVALARLEEVLKRRSKQVHHHHVELHVGHRGIRSDVVESRHAG